LNLGVASLFKPKSQLEAENAALRQQLIVLQRQVRGRVQFTNSDRLFFIQLYRWFPSVLKAMTIMRPETVTRWHRAGFRRYWRWKSRNLGGRPKIAAPAIKQYDGLKHSGVGQMHVEIPATLCRAKSRGAGPAHPRTFRSIISPATAGI
jgi:hypothetical protein